MPKSEIEQVLRMARAYAAEKLPWFAPAIYAAPLVITESCPSIAAIDSGMRVYFNPKHVAKLLASKEEVKEALPELAFLWVHEISHRLREHKERALEKGAHPTLWQCSADLEINDAQWEGLTPPKLFPPLLPKHFKLANGKSAEFYHDELLRQGWMPDALTLDEGSGVHGQKREWELPEDDPRTSAIPTVEQGLIQRSVAEAITHHKRQGEIPQGWVRWAEEVLEPKVD